MTTATVSEMVRVTKVDVAALTYRLEVHLMGLGLSEDMELELGILDEALDGAAIERLGARLQDVTLEQIEQAAAGEDDRR